MELTSGLGEARTQWLRQSLRGDLDASNLIILTCPGSLERKIRSNRLQANKLHCCFGRLAAAVEKANLLRGTPHEHPIWPGDLTTTFRPFDSVLLLLKVR